MQLSAIIDLEGKVSMCALILSYFDLVKLFGLALVLLTQRILAWMSIHIDQLLKWSCWLMMLMHLIDLVRLYA